VWCATPNVDELFEMNAAMGCALPAPVNKHHLGGLGEREIDLSRVLQ
jgi:hypothetical protein